MTHRFIIFVMCLIFASNYAHAFGDKGIITGKVIDEKSKNPLESASVILLGTQLGAQTDEEGRFTISDIIPGEYVLQIQYVGYDVKKKTVVVKPGKPIELTLSLTGAAIMSEQVVVTGTRTEKFKRDVPVIVNVIDAEMIQATQSLNLAEGLNFQPGVRVENNCQNCGFNQVRMNGLEGKYSQILINSRPVFSALAGVYGLEHFPSIMIDRVEIMRGGGSSVYGGNAIAGTINIITKEPTKNSFELSTNTAFIDGSIPDNQMNLAASVVSDNRQAGMFLFGNYRNRNHYDANGDGFSELSEIEDIAVGLQGYYNFSEFSRIKPEFHVSYEDRRGGNDFDKFMHQSDVSEGATHVSLNGGVNYEYFLSEDYKQKLDFYFSTRQTFRDSYYGGGEDPNAYGRSEDLSVVTGAQYSTILNALGGKHQLIAGTEIKYSELEDSQPAIPRSIFQVVREQALFVQDDWDINDKLCLLLGARLDNHNLIDNLIINPRLSVLAKLTNELQLRGSIATGFRAPQTFDEDLHILSAEGVRWIYKNADDLEEERSLSLSGSLDYTIRDVGSEWGVTLEGFYTSLSDAFATELDEVNSTSELEIYQRVNSTGAVVAGATLEGRYLTPYMQIQIGATLQSGKYDDPIDITDEIVSDEILRSPSFYGYFSTNFEVTSKLDLNISGVYTGSMFLLHEAGYIPEDLLVESDPFFELNTKVSYLFGNSDFEDTGLTVSLGVQNIFNSYQDDFDKTADRDPAYIYGPTRPRTYFVGTKVHF